MAQDDLPPAFDRGVMSAIANKSVGTSTGPDRIIRRIMSLAHRVTRSGRTDNPEGGLTVRLPDVTRRSR
jgi:hypothetical protein